MTKSMPPIPPQNRSPKGPGSDTNAAKGAEAAKKPDDRDRNLEEQGRQGNIKQNTTHQGYQQDR